MHIRRENHTVPSLLFCKIGGLLAFILLFTWVSLYDLDGQVSRKCIPRGPEVTSHTLNFYAQAATTKYENWLFPYAFFALTTNTASYAELVVLNVPSFLSRYHNLFVAGQKYFPNRIMVREFNPTAWQLANRLVQNPGNAVRFFERPTLNTTFTYIGDVDIIITDSDIVRIHRQHMAATDLPYSNVIRNHAVQQAEQRLTGLHFVENARYYTRRFDRMLLKYKNLGSSKPLVMDEIALQVICRDLFGSPTYNDTWIRPGHGIHLSNNRGLGQMALSSSCSDCRSFRAIASQGWYADAIVSSKSMKLIDERCNRLCACCVANVNKCTFNDETYTRHWIEQFDDVSDDSNY